MWIIISHEKGLYQTIRMIHGKEIRGFVSWLTSLLFVQVIVYGFNHGKSPLHHYLGEKPAVFHSTTCIHRFAENCQTATRSGWLHQRDVSASGIENKTNPPGCLGCLGQGIHEIRKMKVDADLW